MRREKTSLLRSKGVQSLLASLLCIVIGLLIGYIVLLIINPAGAGEAIRTIVENFLYYPSAAARLRYFGNQYFFVYFRHMLSFQCNSDLILRVNVLRRDLKSSFRQFFRYDHIGVVLSYLSEQFFSGKFLNSEPIGDEFIGLTIFHQANGIFLIFSRQDDFREALLSIV